MPSHFILLVIRIDIKQDNLIQRILDPSSYDEFIQDEMDNPSPRKSLMQRQQFKVAKVIEKLLLCDYGNVVRGDESRNPFAQPDIFRSP
ncbi:hypothetical protein N7467_004594 [Penicillium canescens]|nr:hypothetical protein N7467_004594 [Penicillium canescens]